MLVDEEMLTAEEVAELLKLSTKTLLRHSREGQVPGMKIGRVWRFQRSELLALLGARRVL